MEKQVCLSNKVDALWGLQNPNHWIIRLCATNIWHVAFQRLNKTTQSQANLEDETLVKCHFESYHFMKQGSKGRVRTFTENKKMVCCQLRREGYHESAGMRFRNLLLKLKMLFCECNGAENKVCRHMSHLSVDDKQSIA